MVDMPALNDKHTQRIIEYLRKLGWSDAEILRFIDYIAG